jgi:pimeloyl-ACP methyl ester carboxylesterase
MRTWVKVLLAALVALAVLLILNTVVLDRQTKSAESITEAARDGATILPLPGGDLKVVDTGAGAPIAGKSPIVLLHCYTCAINWWDKIIPLLRRRHRVIAIDLLGHGGSEMPSKGYSMENQAQLVAQALDRLGVRDATIVGHSLGGAVAVALAEQSPKLVDRLVIVDTEPNTSYGGLDLLAKAALTPVIGEAMWRVKMDWSVRKGLEQAFAPGYDVPDAFVDDVERMTYTAYDHSHGGFDSYVDDSPLDQRLRRIGLPLLAIFGNEDQIVDSEQALRAYAAVPGAEVRAVRGAGHSPNVEKPAETAALILRFAAEPRRPAASGSTGPTQAHGAAGPAVTATCGKAIIGPGRAGWRRRSTAAGPFGLFGAGRDLSQAQPIGEIYVTKVPAVLEGRRSAVLRVPASERSRAGLIYGPINSAHTLAETARQVTFRPCPDKPRTVWPGGLGLADRKPLTLELAVGGSVRRLRLR